MIYSKLLNSETKQKTQKYLDCLEICEELEIVDHDVQQVPADDVTALRDVRVETVTQHVLDGAERLDVTLARGAV